MGGQQAEEAASQEGRQEKIEENASGKGQKEIEGRI